MGSEKEILEEQFVPSRRKIRLIVSRKRKEFGAQSNFVTTNCMSEISEEERISTTRRQSIAEKEAEAAFIKSRAQVYKTEITSDPATQEKHTLKQMLVSIATQAISVTESTSIQTDWKVKKNACIQTEPRENTELVPYKNDEGDLIDPMVIDPDLLRPAVDCILQALEQNAIGNIFEDDWSLLGRKNEEFGGNSDTHLKEYQSFTDLSYSKDKKITWCEWHPTIQGVLACSCAKRFSLDERIDSSHRNIVNPSFILIWSFSDPIHPKLLLEAPDDVCSFKFCPSDPNMIIGGCFNGQLVIWDISEYVDKIKIQSSSKRSNTTNSSQATQFGEEPEPETPKIMCSAVSAIDKGSIHKAPVSYINFVPTHLEFDKQGN